MLESLLNNKNRIIISIDLSSRINGVCIFKGERLVKMDIVNLCGWEFIKKSNYQNVYKMIESIKKCVNKLQNENEKYELHVVIELSNFKNPLLTNRFHFITGMIICGLLDANISTTFKLVNNNEWFQHFWNQYGDNTCSYINVPREQRKALSKQMWLLKNDFNKEQMEQEYGAGCEDLGDAFWMGHYYDILFDTFDKSEIVKKQRKFEVNERTKRLKSELRNLKKEVKQLKKGRK